MAASNRMKISEKGALKGIAFGLFGFVFSFLVILMMTYVALYGPEVPVEIRWRSDVATGEKLRLQKAIREKKMVQDSAKVLQQQIKASRKSVANLQKKMENIQTNYKKLAGRKSSLEARVAVLQAKTDSLNNALTAEQIKRVQRVAKMLKKMSGQKVSQYLLSLDNKTVLTLLQISPERQAAKILSALTPSRAAELTRRYVSLN
ncbi:hypothetical protein BMS3Abin05_02318 [bacterium BMS3Abin05]|nr:hypothetical protein BMS3Abin05_02318 [bacterium BMS3Abin05]GBE27916.1 hypothetical protein BMS3Bbin03_01847 [bacterium BMS3Bbin03]